METQVLEVEVERERARLCAFLGLHLPGHGGERHYDWLYLSNPDGNAKAWVVQDERRELVGVAAAFPRTMYVRGEPVRCWNLGDFVIREDARSLGPAIRLQRACLAPVLSGDAPFAYDHPSCNMMAVYRWLKIAQTGRVIRYVRPLRMDTQVRSALGPGPLARTVGRVGNAGLDVAGRLLRVRSHHRAEVRREPLGVAFDELARSRRSAADVVGVRSSAYLAWRYLQCPGRSYEIVTVEERSLLGYAVYSLDGAKATVPDILYTSGDDVGLALLGEVVRAATESGAESLSVPTLEGSPLVSLLEQNGFHPRDRANFVVATRPGGAWSGIVDDARRWYHTDGDRDV